MLNLPKTVHRGRNNKLPGVGMIALDVLPIAILLIGFLMALAGRFS